MALQAAELRKTLIEQGVAESAARRIIVIAEESIAEERERINGELAARDERFDRVAEQIAELAALMKQLAAEYQDFKLEQERFRSELVRTETEAKSERKAAQAERGRIEREAAAERGRIEREAKAERERIAREAQAEREAMEARIKIDLRNQILIGVGLVLGGIAVSTGIILGVLG